MAQAGVRTDQMGDISIALSFVVNGEEGTGVMSAPAVAMQVMGQIGPQYDSVAELIADLSWPAGSIAAVWSDDGGIYRKVGASGEGYWNRVGDIAALKAAYELARRWASADEGEVIADGKESSFSYSQKSRRAADDSAQSETNAAGHEAGALAYKNAAVAASEASGDVRFFDSRADADSALGGLDEGQVVEVFADETRAGNRTRYRVEAGVLVHKLAFLKNGVEFARVGDLLGDGLYTYASGVVGAGDVIAVRDGGFSYDVLPEATADHDPLTNPMGAWPLGTALKLRGRQVAGGGFDARQFGIVMDGTDQSDKINLAIRICSGFSLFAGYGNTNKPTVSTPLRFPAGHCGFSDTIVLWPFVHLVGQGRFNTVLQRIGGSGHSMASLHFDDLEADPSSQPLPPGMGLIGMTVIDGVPPGLGGAGASAGCGVGLNGYAMTVKDLFVFAPNRSFGIYANGKRQAARDAGTLDTRYPWSQEEDTFDEVYVSYAGGDGFVCKLRDAKIGDVVVTKSEKRGFVVDEGANSIRVRYGHFYGNKAYNGWIFAPVIKFVELEARDGAEGGVAILGTDVVIGVLRANNNRRRLDGVFSGSGSPGWETQPDVLIANRDIDIDHLDVTVSRGGVGVLVDASALPGNTTVSGIKIAGRIEAPESGTFAGKGTALKFATVGVGNTVDLTLANFDDAEAKGVHIAPGAGQTGLDLKTNVRPSENPVSFVANQFDGVISRSNVTIRGSSDKATLLAGPASLANSRIDLYDYAVEPKRTWFAGNTPDIDVTEPGIHTAVIPIPGGWLGGTPAANAGQAQATVVQASQIYDYEIEGLPVLAINDDNITVRLKVKTPSAASEANVRVNVEAWVGRR